MKYLRVLLIAVFFAMLSTAEHAADEQYIVYLRTDDSALLAAKDGMPAFSVVDADTLARLQSEDAVLWYEEDVEIRLTAAGYSDPYYIKKWDLTMIDAQSAWNMGYMGEGITIGVIDSGVQPDHPDLAENLLPTVCYLEGVDASTDTIGHGTFVTGMIAAGINGVGTIGAAPKAKIQPLKCFDASVPKTTISMMVRSVYDAVDLYGCRILNMSCGATENSLTLKKAIEYAIARGCIVVAAVGNDGNDVPNYPAAYSGVIGVGSVGQTKAVSSTSQKNASVKLVAPGERVFSTFSGSRYGTWSGTSFAAPLVSAAAALLLNADPTLTPTEMTDLLTRSAVRLGTDAYSTSYGYGLLDIGRALRSLAGVPGDMDRDGDLTMRDVLLLLRAVLDADHTVDPVIADFDGNGSVALADVLLLLRNITA